MGLHDLADDRALDGVGVLGLVDQDVVEGRQRDAFLDGEEEQAVIEVEQALLAGSVVRELGSATIARASSSAVRWSPLPSSISRSCFAARSSQFLFGVIEQDADAGILREAYQLLDEVAVCALLRLAVALADHVTDLLAIDGGLDHRRVEAGHRDVREAVEGAGVDAARLECFGDVFAEREEDGGADEPLDDLDQRGGLARAGASAYDQVAG